MCWGLGRERYLCENIWEFHCGGGISWDICVGRFPDGGAGMNGGEMDGLSGWSRGYWSCKGIT